MVMMKKVTKEEFDTFVANYKRKLNYDCYAVIEPPMITYNDFTLGNWPESVVARTYLYDEKEGGYFYVAPDKRVYMIAELDKNGEPIPETPEPEENKEKLIVEIHPDGTIIQTLDANLTATEKQK